MKRKEFIDRCCTCGALSLLGLCSPRTVSGKATTTEQKDLDDIPMNKDQIQAVIEFIDSSVNDSDKARIFEKLGAECFHSRHMEGWINSFKDNQDEFFDRVKRGESTYWEKLEYDKRNSVITLVGREASTCVCQYGQGEQPPQSLCNHCCRKFQEVMFEHLLERKVKVRIDESVILGSNRCSTTIFVI